MSATSTPDLPTIDPAFIRWLQYHALVQTAQGWAPLVLTPGQWEALVALSGFFGGVQGIYAAIKARQVGWTTLLLLWTLWKCVSSPGSKILWLTPKEEPYGVEVLAKWKDLVRVMQSQEGSGVDSVGLLNHSVNETVFANGSRVAWHHIGGAASIAEAVGRSGTFGWAIVTEAAYPDDPHLMRLAIESGLRPALEKWRAALMFDSTCNGMDGPGEPFYGYVQDVLKGREKGAVKLLPWWTSPDYRDDVGDVDALVNSYGAEEFELARDFDLKPGQIAWRRRVRGTTPAQVARFSEKYPERTIAGAFLQKGGGSVVDAEAMNDAEARLRRVGNGALSHAAIEAAGLKRVGLGDPLFQDEGERGYFRVFILPSGAGRTWGALDCSDGHTGSDWQAVAVVAEDGEVAALGRLRADKMRLGGALQRVVEWYGCERVHIESQGGGAEVASYIRHGVRVEARGINPAELEVLGHRCEVRIQLEQTTEEIRTEAIGEALRLFGDGSKVPDLETLGDLRDLRRRGGRVEHREGGHDDSILAVGFARVARRRDLLKEARRAEGGGRRAASEGRGRRGGDFKVGGVKAKRYGYMG